jgi:Protein of unknown function (DUF3631)/Bifunctional DNA primase/polymerase, N-terminal
MNLLASVLAYSRRGWSPVPMPVRTKAPRIANWQKLRLTDADVARCFNRPGNVGIILGDASSGLVDVDLDCREALEFGPSRLPATGATFGRASKRNSHRLYQVDVTARSLQFKDPITDEMLLELRGDRAQTVFPPSIHPSGESIEWEADGELPRIDYAALKKAVTWLAARCLVARYLPEVSDLASLLNALDTADRRVAARIKEWLGLSQPLAVGRVEVSPRIDLDGNFPPPLIIPGSLPPHIPACTIGRLLVDRELLFWARYDLDECVYQLRNQQKPGRADLLYKKAIRMGVFIAGGEIDQAEVTNALYEASVFNGLVDENGEHDVRRNIERGFKYGATIEQETTYAQTDLGGGQGRQGGGAGESQQSTEEGKESASDEADESQSSSDGALIDELAKLSIVAYSRRRQKAAEQLGIGVGFLDEAVKRRRAELEGEVQEQPLFPHWTVEPWPKPVDGDALILALVRRIRSHVVMSPEAALTVALWIMFAWVHDEAAIHSPILMVTSPEAECGKTTLLGLVGFLVPRSLSSVGISPAALFRAIEKWQPTLIIDEADAAFVQNEDLRAVINSGWTRGQGVVRCDGDDNEPRLFSTFCPKAIGLKGKKLPDTTASRAIVIELKRKLAHENVADFRHVDDPGLEELRQRLLRWAIDNSKVLREASPTLPHGFAHRVAANWHLSLAIAEAAGGEWPEKAREAAAAIAKLKATLDASIGIQLLSDIRAAFGSGIDRLFSSTLIDKLTADPEGPWAEYNRGKPFTQKQLASRLRDYGILSETVWIDGKSAKGYKRAAFEDAWTRYLQA